MENTNLTQNTEPTVQTSQKKSKKWLASLLCIVVAVAAFIILYPFSEKDDLQNSDSNNLFSQGLTPVCVDDKWGYINEQGDLIIEPQFDMVLSFSENGLAPVSFNNEWGYINTNGNFVIEPQFDTAEKFAKNGLARVRADDKLGFIDEKGEFVIEPLFMGAGDFTENGLARAARADNGKYGYINKKGNFVIEPQFDYAEDFLQCGLARVEIDYKWGVINERGDYVVNCESDVDIKYITNIKPYDDGYIVVTGSDNSYNSHGKTAIFNSDGEQIFID